MADDGRVYACADRDDYNIKVWAPDGSLERIITRECERYKRSDDEKEDVARIWSAFLQRVPDPDFRVDDYDKDIQNLWVRDDGSIWVLSATGARNRPDGSAGVFDILDSEGHFVRQVTLHGQGDPFALPLLLENLANGKYGSVTREFEALHAQNMQMMNVLYALRSSNRGSSSSPAVVSPISNIGTCREI